jgi:hypothetical protein
MNKKIFTNSKKWSKSNSKIVGLPRPFYAINDFFLKVPSFRLAKKIPVPWQSLPVFDKEKITVFNVIEENESLVISDGRCGYCGIKFNAYDDCSRWTIEKGTPSLDGKTSSNVFSDNYPLHKECMRQARIFCPFMKLRNETEFEYGTFLTLKENAEIFINKHKDVILSHKKIPPVS